MSEPPRYKARMRSEPWLVPGAIAFLRQFTTERPGCDVLEFGGGASTIWFLRQDCRVVSFESKLSWRERITDVAANRNIVTKTQAACLDLREWQDDVPSRLLEWFGEDSFDLVLVDGLDRLACLLMAVPLVRPGGVLMQDNAGRTTLPRKLPKGTAFPDWDWTCCVQTSPDKFDVSRIAWERGWTTAWWQRPVSPLPAAIYYDAFSEHLR